MSQHYEDDDTHEYNPNVSILTKIWIAICNFFANLMYMFTSRLEDTMCLDGKPGPEGKVGPEGAMGPIGLPGDYMYKAWLKKNPNKSIDDFIKWFKNKLKQD